MCSLIKENKIARIKTNVYLKTDSIFGKMGNATWMFYEKRLGLWFVQSEVNVSKTSYHYRARLGANPDAYVECRWLYSGLNPLFSLSEMMWRG